MAKRTLYLHIGAHRTATTSLQAFLATNRNHLEQHGFQYAYKSRRHFLVARDILMGRRSAQDVGAEIAAAADRAAHPIHSIILSDEDICKNPDLSAFAGLSAHFDLRIVYSLRRQDLWLESWFLQNVKWQWDKTYAHMDFASFMAQRAAFPWIDYCAYVTRLESVFGKDNLLLVPYEREQMPLGPLPAICAALGIPPKDGEWPKTRANHSFSPLISEFMRQLPLDVAADPIRKIFERSCMMLDQKLVKTPEESTALLLGHDQRRQILDEYAAGNAALAQRYFGRDALFLAPLPDQADPVASLALPADSAALMTRLVAPLVAAMIVQLEKQAPQK